MIGIRDSALPNRQKNAVFPGVIELEHKPRIYPPLNELVRDADQFLQQIRIPTVNHLQFFLNDIPFQASKTTLEDGRLHLCLWATLGYLPYSAESAEKRRILVDILNSVTYLTVAKIGVDRELKIIARGDFLLKKLELPTFIFPPLLAFWQEAGPFIKLIGEYL
jgi:hypothetical protein